MEESVAGFLSIDNVPDLRACLRFTRIADLPAISAYIGEVSSVTASLSFTLTTSSTVPVAASWSNPTKRVG